MTNCPCFCWIHSSNGCGCPCPKHSPEAFEAQGGIVPSPVPTPPATPKCSVTGCEVEAWHFHDPKAANAPVIYPPVPPATSGQEAPGHTDLMVSPEGIDEYLEKNPPQPPASSTPPVGCAVPSCGRPYLHPFHQIDPDDSGAFRHYYRVLASHAFVPCTNPEHAIDHCEQPLLLGVPAAGVCNRPRNEHPGVLLDGPKALAGELDRLRQELAAAKEKVEGIAQFHTSGCEHAEIAVANCCEGNDAALLGMQHWEELREVRKELDQALIQIAEHVEAWSQVREVYEHAFPDRPWEAGPPHQRAAMLAINQAREIEGLKAKYEAAADSSNSLFKSRKAVLKELDVAEAQLARVTEALRKVEWGFDGDCCVECSCHPSEGHVRCSVGAALSPEPPSKL